MQKYVNNITTVIDGKLEPLSSASVTVYEGGTNTFATLYSDNGTTTTANPLTTTDTGRVEFYVEDGRYDFVIAKPGYSTLNIQDILFDDPEDPEDLENSFIDFVTPLLALKIDDAPNIIDNTKLAMAPAFSIKGNKNNFSTDPQDLTAKEVTSLLGFDFTKATPGEIVFPAVYGDSAPLRIKFGFSTSNGAQTYATAFPNAFLAIYATPRGNTYSTYTVSITGTTTTGFNAYPKGWDSATSTWVTSTSGFNWIAIGY